jgi:hypothetical protein
VRDHPALFTENRSLGHVENVMEFADMVESGRQILGRLVVDLECDDGQLPTINGARDRRTHERRRFIERQHAQTIADA